MLVHIHPLSGGDSSPERRVPMLSLRPGGYECVARSRGSRERRDTRGVGRYRSRKAKRKREQGQTDLVPIRIHDAGSPVGIVHRAGSAEGVEDILECARATRLSGEWTWVHVVRARTIE